jgi:hypothetical protein
MVSSKFEIKIWECAISQIEGVPNRTLYSQSQSRFLCRIKKKFKSTVMYVYIFPLAQMQYLIFKSTKDHSNLYKILKTKLGTFFNSIV